MNTSIVVSAIASALDKQKMRIKTLEFNHDNEKSELQIDISYFKDGEENGRFEGENDIL